MSRDPTVSAVPGDSLGVMWKTVSTDCNLACDYCYYSACNEPRPTAKHRIDPGLLEKAICQLMSEANGAIGFAWQGGEPLLAGLPFFQEAVALQIQYAPPNTVIGNALQTNGTLLNDDWAAFFRQYNFLVGVSIDGPREIHDAHRVTVTGKGTFDLVMRKILHLRRHNVDFNILTVLHKDNVRRAHDLMSFYASEGFGYVQFIPGMAFHAGDCETAPRYLVTAEEYGEFLCDAFDLWYNNGAPKLSIRCFDDLVSIYAGHAAGSCKQCRMCSRTLVLEQNGDAYPCDFYMGPARRLGNIGYDSWRSIIESSTYRDFRRLKERLPAQCHRCRFRSACQGGCPRDRTWDKAGRVTSPDYFCAAKQRLFAHAHDRLELLARRIRARSLFSHATSAGSWPERNAPCVCGSGKKFKRCCGPLRDELGSRQVLP